MRQYSYFCTSKASKLSTCRQLFSQVRHTRYHSLRLARQHPHLHTSAYVSIRQHTSAYVSICQHTTSALLGSIRTCYVSIRQHTSAHSARVSIQPPPWQTAFSCFFPVQKAFFFTHHRALGKRARCERGGLRVVGVLRELKRQVCLRPYSTHIHQICSSMRTNIWQIYSSMRTHMAVI